MPKHTPGPWNIVAKNHIEAGKERVAYAVGNSEANAALIAAAPEMLEALIAARTFIEEAMHFVTNNEERMTNIRAFGQIEKAIRKARGET